MYMRSSIYIYLYVMVFVYRLFDQMKENGVSDDKLKEFKTKIQEWVSNLMKKDRFKKLQFFCGMDKLHL